MTIEAKTDPLSLLGSKVFIVFEKTEEVPLVCVAQGVVIRSSIEVNMNITYYVRVPLRDRGLSLRSKTFDVPPSRVFTSRSEALKEVDRLITQTYKDAPAASASQDCVGASRQGSQEP